KSPRDARRTFFDAVLEFTSKGETYHRIETASKIAPDIPTVDAVAALGNGSNGTVPDTVPFCLWSSAAHLDDYAEAIWATISGLGDSDTNCAIVGGIVALSAGAESIPAEWLKAREPLKF